MKTIAHRLSYRIDILNLVISKRCVMLSTLILSLLLLPLACSIGSAHSDMPLKPDSRTTDDGGLCHVLPIMFRHYGDTVSIDAIRKTRNTLTSSLSGSESVSLCKTLARLIPQEYSRVDCMSASIEAYYLDAQTVTQEKASSPQQVHSQTSQVVVLTTPEGGGQSRVFFRHVQDTQWLFVLYEGGDALSWVSEYYTRDSDSVSTLSCLYRSTDYSQIELMRDDVLKKYDCASVCHDGDAEDTIVTRRAQELGAERVQQHADKDGEFWFVCNKVVCGQSR